ncbi:hypothetical protein ACXR2U_12300 [Jatrophihabitans sp. YIM 134969]
MTAVAGDVPGGAAAPATVPAAAPSAAALAVASIVAGVVNYAFTLVLSYNVPASAYAVFAGAQSLILMTGVVGSVGIPYVVAQETRAAVTTGDDARFRRAVTFAFWTNLALGTVTGLVVAGLVLDFGSGLDAALTGGTVFVLAVGSTGLGVLQGRGRTTALAAVILAEVLVKFGVGVGLAVTTDAGSAVPLLGFLLGSGAVFATAPVFVRAIGAPRHLASTLPLVVSAAQIGGLQVGVGIVAVLDTLVAATVSAPASQVASFQVASTVGKSALFISSAVALAVFPLLGGRDDAAQRAAALRAFTVAGGFVWLALVTVPGDLVRDVFADDFADIGHYLPYAAAAGFGLGLANVVTTFVQSYQRAGSPGAGRRVALMVPVLLVGVGAMLLGARLGGVTGLAVGAVVSAWVSVAVYVALPREHRFLRVRPSPSRRSVAGSVVVVVAIAAMVVARTEVWSWLVVAVVVGLGAAVVAFPEVRGRRPEPVGGR